MKPIQPSDRRVANIHEGEYVPWVNNDGSSDSAILQLNPDRPLGTGFHIYRMDPGARSDAHEHMGAEEFLVLEGELIDNDGTVYRKGDVVWLGKGTQHYSDTPNGCLLAVYIEHPEQSVDPD
ncbi:cupin domain-containing protein [Rhodobacteraceae bacterium NNCM2]|nr:cupin domain-containing protein [Coraliihabitans acroporae]